MLVTSKFKINECRTRVPFGREDHRVSQMYDSPPFVRPLSNMKRHLGSISASVMRAVDTNAIYERSARQIATALNMLLTHEHLTVQDADVAGAATRNFRERPINWPEPCALIVAACSGSPAPLFVGPPWFESYEARSRETPVRVP